MLKKWSLEGFQSSTTNELFRLPVFSKEENNVIRLYVQFTFSSRNDYFELIEIKQGDCSIDLCRQPADPEKTLYYGICVGSDSLLVKRSELETVLRSLDVSNLSPSAVLQYADLSQNFDSLQLPYSFIAMENDPSFWATLSAQKFVDSAITKISNRVHTQDVIRRILWCSRWVTDWDINRIPAVYIKDLLRELTVDADELQQDLLIEMKSQLSAASLEQQALNKLSRALESINKLKRQELRLSRLLKVMIDDPSNGKAVVLHYHPKTKYEAIVIPLIKQVSLSILDADIYEREIRIAQIIPKIFVKYFPIRRGRFLVDFIRTFSEYRHIRDQLAHIYEQKRATYGVGLYSSVIEDLLKN